MKELLIFTFSIIIVINIHAQDTLKIMPVGNSITAGEHYHEPALEERTGYRKDLYEMLIDSGYIVDFVGSQSHGIRSPEDEDWYDWNNEAYPGWKIPGIAGKVEIALGIYKPDILLVHVGTNGTDWNGKPGQVGDMLDMINNFSVENNHPMTVFLCKIINRFNGGHAPTTQFNNDVAESVAARTGDKIKIILVDMENGAGLDYSDAPADPNADPPYEGGDMWGTKYPGVSNDLYHPNDKGNTKMAVLFYEEIVKELGSPLAIGKTNPVPGTAKVYPNPTNTYLTVETGISDLHTIEITSLNGQLIKSVDMEEANYQLDFSDFQKGVYFITIRSKDYLTTRKIIKM
jgi:lysophospholipase L1-like esterase